MNDIFDWNAEPDFTCRFHPTDSFHEVGCSHKEWSNEDLLSALKKAKRTIEFHFPLMVVETR